MASRKVALGWEDLGAVDQLKLIICTYGLCSAVRDGKERVEGRDAMWPSRELPSSARNPDISVTSSWASCHRGGATRRTIIRLRRVPQRGREKRTIRPCLLPHEQTFCTPTNLWPGLLQRIQVDSSNITVSFKNNSNADSDDDEHLLSIYYVLGI